MAASLGATSLADVHHEGLNEVLDRVSCLRLLLPQLTVLDITRPGKFLSCTRGTRAAGSRRPSS